jgi:hypothetical protein
VANKEVGANRYPSDRAQIVPMREKLGLNTPLLAGLREVLRKVWRLLGLDPMAVTVAVVVGALVKRIRVVQQEMGTTEQPVVQPNELALVRGYNTFLKVQDVFCFFCFLVCLFWFLS